MGLKFDYFILTINNRGLYLAMDLLQKGKKVAWLDISELSCWSSKDFSGPLPFHLRRGIDETDHQRFLSQMEADFQEQGLSLLTENGILELNGEISEHQISSFGQNEDLRRLQSTSFKTLSAMSKDLKSHWLLHFFAAFNKSIIQEESISPLLNLRLSDVFSKTYYPVENFSQRQKVRRHLQSLGAEVLEPQKVEMRTEGSQFFLKQGDSVLSANSMISFIEAHDVQLIDSEFSAQIFVQKPTVSPWSWQRLDLRWESSNDLSKVPQGFILLSHWDLPWLEDNFIVLRRNRDSEWSLWFKSKRQGAIDRDELKSLLINTLKKKFFHDEFKLEEALTHEGLQFQLFPIYEEKPNIQIKKSLNFFSMGFDHYFSFDLFESYQSQKVFVQQLLRSAQ